MMFQYSDEDLIAGLRQRNSSYIDFLYQEFFPIVRHHLLHNSGTHQDGEDLFHDGLIVLYNRIQTEPFKLECSLKTYFTAICKNLWLQRLERRYKLIYHAECEVQEEPAEYVTEDHDPTEQNLEQQRLFHKNLMQLPVECRRLLQLYCLKIPYREIAKLLKYKDEVYVKTRKYSCKKMLRKKIIKDPECDQFIKHHGSRNVR
jgi:RNA polymerase sigma factor (sigma-70 family)